MFNILDCPRFVTSESMDHPDGLPEVDRKVGKKISRKAGRK